MMPTTGTLRRALPCLLARPSSQRPALISPMVRSVGHSSVRADKLNMSGDIWKKRLSDLLWNCLWRRVLSLLAWYLFSRLDHILRRYCHLLQKSRIVAAMWPSVCIAIRIWSERRSEAVDGTGQMKGNLNLPPALPRFLTS